MKVKILSLLTILTLFGEEQPTIKRLQNGLFLGLGGNYNSVKIDRHLHGTAFSSIFLDSSLVALGESGGPANPYHATHSTLAPQAQLGYLHRFSNGCWLMGCKAVYQYLNLTFTENNLDSFQAGMYTSVAPGGDTWIGHFLIGSSQTQVNHELFFLPIFGYFYHDSSIYLGGGPVVFGTESDLYDLRALCFANGETSDRTGSATKFSFSQWIWGGIAQLGWIYPLTPSWFLDLNYTYAVTANYTFNDSALFANSLITNSVYTEEGIAFIKTRQRVTAQSFTITMNKAF